jgi:transketolase
MRIGRGQDPDVYDPAAPPELRLGQAIAHGTGSDLTIIATGSMVAPSLKAAEALRADGHDLGVLDMHTIKPLDHDAVLSAAGRSRCLLTVEEHNILGGLAGAVAEVLAEAGAATPLARHGIQDEYSLIGPPTHLYRHYGLDEAGVTARARALLA